MLGNKMPLMRGKSERSFDKNVATEMDAGKPQKQSLAIAYAMKKKAMEHKARRGEMGSGMGHYAEGGMQDECKDCMSGHCDVHDHDMLEDDDDIVDRIMRKGLKKMSEGGRVANEDHGEDDEYLADFSPNEFDDLSLNDDLEPHYKEDDYGDDMGDDEEDDMVNRIMRKSRMKDRMPISGYGMSYGRNK
jgi:hypothetical protein